MRCVVDAHVRARVAARAIGLDSFRAMADDEDKGKLASMAEAFDFGDESQAVPPARVSSRLLPVPSWTPRPRAPPPPSRSTRRHVASPPSFAPSRRASHAASPNRGCPPLVSAARAATASSAREAPPATSPRSSCTPAGTTPRSWEGAISVGVARASPPRRPGRASATVAPTRSDVTSDSRSVRSCGRTGHRPPRRSARGARNSSRRRPQSRRRPSSAALLANRLRVGVQPGMRHSSALRPVPWVPDADPRPQNARSWSPPESHRSLTEPAGCGSPTRTARAWTCRCGWTVKGRRRGRRSGDDTRAWRTRSGDIRGDHLAGGDAVHPAVLVASRVTTLGRRRGRGRPGGRRSSVSRAARVRPEPDESVHPCVEDD